MPELPVPSYFLSLPEGKNLFRRASAALACLLEWSRQKRFAAGEEQFPSLFPTTILKCQEREEVVEGSQGSE